MEVQGAIGWTRYAATMDLPVEIIEDSEAKRIERHRQPLGVVASITLGTGTHDCSLAYYACIACW